MFWEDVPFEFELLVACCTGDLERVSPNEPKEATLKPALAICPIIQAPALTAFAGEDREIALPRSFMPSETE